MNSDCSPIPLSSQQREKLFSLFFTFFRRCDCVWCMPFSMIHLSLSSAQSFFICSFCWLVVRIMLHGDEEIKAKGEKENCEILKTRRIQKQTFPCRWRNGDFLKWKFFRFCIHHFSLQNPFIHGQRHCRNCSFGWTLKMISFLWAMIYRFCLLNGKTFGQTKKIFAVKDKSEMRKTTEEI